MSGPLMRAAVLHGREDVRVEDVPRPRPGPGEVLLRNRVALTCGTDLKVFRRGYHARMIVPPSLFGHEVAGVLEELGEGVAGVSAGTPVVIANSAPCDTCEFCREGRHSLCDDLLFWNGAYAEFSLVPARIVARNMLVVPDGVPLAAAALTEPLACVLRGVEACGLRPGQTAAVIGAGPIGLMFVAVLFARGVRVVVAGRRSERLSVARLLGAAAVVEVDDPEALARLLREESPGGRGPHAVIEAVGSAAAFQAAVLAVRKGGRVNLFGGCPAGTSLDLEAQRLHYEELTILATFHHTPSAIREALGLIAEGGLNAGALVGGEAPLERLPEVLLDMARGGAPLKTAIVLESIGV